MTSSPDRGPAGRARVYLLAAHPQWRESRVTRHLLEAARALAPSHGGTPDIDVNDLYGSYPDYAIDAEAERERLARADLLVLLHPIHWYSMPPLQKLWIDEVLRYGWAYGPGGTALRGKDFWLVASTGGARESYHQQGYNRYGFDAFLPPYEQTAVLCGMRFLPPLVLHGASRVDAAGLQAHADAFVEGLRGHPAPLPSTPTAA